MEAAAQDNKTMSESSTKYQNDKRGKTYVDKKKRAEIPCGKYQNGICLRGGCCSYFHDLNLPLTSSSLRGLFDAQFGVLWTMSESIKETNMRLTVIEKRFNRDMDMLIEKMKELSITTKDLRVSRREDSPTRDNLKQRLSRYNQESKQRSRSQNRNKYL